MTIDKKYPAFLTVKEVAEILRVSPRAVQQLCQDRKIGFTKIRKGYLIPRESLDEYLKIRR